MTVISIHNIVSLFTALIFSICYPNYRLVTDEISIDGGMPLVYQYVPCEWLATEKTGVSVSPDDEERNCLPVRSWRPRTTDFVSHFILAMDGAFSMKRPMSSACRTGPRLGLYLKTCFTH